MSERVLLHVGTPKTGTSYLQDVLFRNREQLAVQGLHYPADRFDGHFLAALDLMQLPWGGLQLEAVNAWDVLSRRVREAEGTAVVSHEILARASRAQAARALESLGHGSGTEVHVLLSVRDLVRQVPAEWQENIKHRATLSYAEFLDELRDPERSGDVASWFWGVQEIPDILDRWASDLPPERVHLITVPPSGGPRDLLWKRFSHAFGLDGYELELTEERANPSLGVPESALLRRINLAVNEDVPPAAYRPMVRELLAHQTLSKRRRTPRLALPPEHLEWVQTLSQSWVSELAARRYDVVGDLEELLGTPPKEYVDPDRPDEAQVAAAAVDAIHALLVESTRFELERNHAWAEVRRARAETEQAREALERSYLRAGYKIRRRFIGALERAGRPGRAMIRGYRWLRGRSSREA